MEFKLNHIEAARAQDWVLKHMEKHRKTKRRKFRGEGRGGAISYVFTPCGIGNGVTVKCACGEGLDVTDISNW